MSRILNRPMFRGGGKVSSYGNGIATGLADGGMPLLVGQHPNSAKGPDGREMHQEVLTGGLPNLEIFNKNYKPQDYYEKKQEFKAYEPEFKTEQDYLNAYNKDLARQENDLLMTYGIDDYSGFQDSVSNDLSYLRSDDGRNKFIDDKRTAQNKIIDEASNYGLDKQTDLEKLIISQTKKDTAAVRTEAEIEADLLKKLKGKELTDEESLAALEKDKALFEKMLGGGKSAKIADASDMALSFASKALGEGATVKSAFADFLADETKRPSRRMKVKDAATQAAIQSYLTGKTSYRKFQNELDSYGAKLEMASKREKAGKGYQEYLKEGTPTGGKKTDMGTIAYAVDKMGEVFGGLVPEDISEVKEEVVYVQDNPNGPGKLLVKWDGTKFITETPVYK